MASMKRSDVREIRRAVGALYGAVAFEGKKISEKDLSPLLDSLGLSPEKILEERAFSLMVRMNDNINMNEAFRVLAFIEQHLIPNKMGDVAVKLLKKVPHVKSKAWKGSLFSRTKEVYEKILSSCRIDDALIEEVRESWREIPELSQI